MTTSPPDSSPPLIAMDARRLVLEEARAALYPQVKAALENASGSITGAAAALGWTWNRTSKLTRRFGLASWARSLRIANRGFSTGPKPRRFSS